MARANALKLGLFALNLEHGGTVSNEPWTLPLDWQSVKRVAQLGDRLGLELLVPVARWRGFGGETNYGGHCYDTFAWAAGLAAATENIHVWSTCHVPTIHPLVAAKQLATIDHISGGRAGVNIVGGWFREELEMFGRPMLEHDRRYELAEEWTQIVNHLWTSEEPLDFHGEFFRIDDGVSKPKPLQDPRPAFMNAGGSPRGQRFAAEYADTVFVFVADDRMEALAENVASYKEAARADFGRELAVWTQASVVCADTDAAAHERLAEIMRGADYVALDNMLMQVGISGTAASAAGVNRDMPRPLVERFVLGWGGQAMVGSPDRVAAQLQALADAGIDGCLLVFPDWERDLQQFGGDVLPLLERAGLRMPSDAAAPQKI